MKRYNIVRYNEAAYVSIVVKMNEIERHCACDRVHLCIYTKNTLHFKNLKMAPLDQLQVVPMLNPDGVVVGNYRCSLSGRDMNRNYRTLLKEAFPCVWYTRNMVKR